MLSNDKLKEMKAAAEKDIADLEKQASEQGLTDAAMEVEGDPVPVVLSLSDENKEASIAILKKVASEMENSDDLDVNVQAAEVLAIADAVEKNAFVYERDTDDPEAELDQFFRDGVVSAPKDEKSSRWVKKFETDDTVEVANFVKNPSPYQKL